MKLFLKGDRCFTDKCAFERRPYPPGQHGQKRAKFSEYALQLREKQKVKRLYSLGERPFRRYFALAQKTKGATGPQLLIELESRLDNVVYLLGFANTRIEARQLVKHGHIRVNGKRVSMPNFSVRKEDKIEVKEASRGVARILSGIEAAKRRETPKWLEPSHDQFMGLVKDVPTREDITTPIEEHMIVEYYSR